MMHYLCSIQKKLKLMKQLILIIAMLISFEIIAKEQEIPVIPNPERTAPKKKKFPKAPEVTLNDNTLLISGVEPVDPIIVEVSSISGIVYETTSTELSFILPILDENQEYTLDLYIGSIWWTGSFVF